MMFNASKSITGLSLKELHVQLKISWPQLSIKVLPSDEQVVHCCHRWQRFRPSYYIHPETNHAEVSCHEMEQETGPRMYKDDYSQHINNACVKAQQENSSDISTFNFPFWD